LSPSLGPGVFDTAGGKTLWEIHEGVIPQQELQRYAVQRLLVFACNGADGTRIAALEHLDEIEELRLVLSHYCVVWATRGSALSNMGL
jgi:[phosphatase 2A protein]-leucine-carboxy methyltransferase